MTAAGACTAEAAASRDAQAIERLLTADLEARELPDIEAWRRTWQAGAGQPCTPFETAVAGGLAADRLGWAFAAGYQAALQMLLGEGQRSAEVRSFCLTEPAGNGPRDIATTATFFGSPGAADSGWQLTGRKQWITLGGACDSCLVLAQAVGPASLLGADADGSATPTRRATGPCGCCAAGRCSGPSLRADAAHPFHARDAACRMQLDAVAVPAEALLAGDGWQAWGKPFRTCEDTLVTAAALAHAVREARRLDWPPTLVERLLAALQALAAVSRLPPDRPAAHLMLSGALALAHPLLAEAGEAAEASAAARADAARRRAGPRPAAAAGGLNARAARTARAWERIRPPA